MGEDSRAVIELADRPWVELNLAERAVFDGWLDSTVRGESLYLLIRFATRRAKRGPKSSSQVFAAVQEQAQPAEIEALRSALEEMTADRDRLARLLEMRRRSDER